jgi:DNA primase
MSLPDEPTRLYQATPVRRIGAHGHVAEGELDALVLVQCGLSAVGLPGATAWQPRHTEMLSGCGRLHTWGDPDKAGRELNDTVCKQIRQAQPARLTIGDVTETYLTAGADAIHELAA